MNKDDRDLKEKVSQLNKLILKSSISDAENKRAAKLAFSIFDYHSYRPIYPDRNVNSLIGRKRVPGAPLNREPIDEKFFENPSRVKYLLEYIKIEPLLSIMGKDYFQLPKERDDYFPHYLNNIFTQYVRDLNLLPVSDFFDQSNLSEVKSLCDAIIESIDSYYSGFPNNSYDILASAMNIVTQHTQEFYNQDTTNLYSYRMRIGDNHVFNKKEMFHIPFELRGIVSTQRYSIPGLPCLYLGSSSYVCWEEMKKPDLNSVQTSMLVTHPNKKVDLLDLAYPPNVIHASIKELMCKAYGSNDWSDFISSLKGYMVIWPLLAACSVRVLSSQDTFKPEYIIPQLLLQWVRLSPKYDGIRYFSVSASSLNKENYHLFLNYALPVKTNEPRGQCDGLKKLFIATDAVPWQLFQVYRNSGIGLESDYIHEVDFEPVLNTKIKYGRTDFAKLESFLKKQRLTGIE